MGRFNCLATVLLIGPQLIEPVQQILNSLEQEPVTPRSSLVLSGSPVKGGILVRIAGEHMEVVSETVRQHLAFVPDMLGDNPWARKW